MILGFKDMLAIALKTKTSSDMAEEYDLAREIREVSDRMRQLECRFNLMAASDSAGLESVIYEMQATAVRMEDLMGRARAEGFPYPFMMMTDPERTWGE